MTSRPTPAAHRRPSSVGRWLTHRRASADLPAAHGRAVAAAVLVAVATACTLALAVAPSVESPVNPVESAVVPVESAVNPVESAVNPVESAAVPAVLPAADLLRAWDRRRAAAYAHGSVSALRALYVRGSRAGTADVAMLREYLRNGLRVTDMRMQLLRVEVLERTTRRWVLRVTDRLQGAVAVGETTSVVLPRDEATTRTITLRRSGASDSWRVASVR